MKLFFVYRTFFLSFVFAFVFSAQAEFSITKPIESIKTFFQALKNVHPIYFAYPNKALNVYVAQIKLAQNPTDIDLLIEPLNKYFKYHRLYYNPTNKGKKKLFRSFFRTTVLNNWSLFYSSPKWHRFLKSTLLYETSLFFEIRNYLSENKMHLLADHLLFLLASFLYKLNFDFYLYYKNPTQKNSISNRNFIEEITDFVLQNFKTLCLSDKGNDVIYYCLQLNKSLKNYTKLAMLEKYVIENIKNLTTHVLYATIKTNPCNKTLKAALCIPPAQQTSLFQNHLLRLAYNTTCKSDSCPLSPSIHPTIQHLITNSKNIFTSRVLERFIENPDLFALAEQVFTLQNEYNNNGYTTFVHGQRLAYYLPELWFTKLWELFNHPVDNFLFTHIKALDYSATIGFKNKKIRKKIRNNGRYNQKSRDRLLFMNIALFGNINKLGSNTADYILSNNNVNNISITLKKVFELYQCASIYEQFKKEIEELEQEQKALSNYGIALVIAVPTKILKKCVFLSKTGGYKRDIFINGIGYTNDIELITTHYKKDASQFKNSDELEFCLIMDTKYGLNPDSGIKITPLIAADPTLFEAFHRKEEALWQKIQQAIVNQGNQIA